MKHILITLLLTLSVVSAAEFDIPYNQQRANGTNAAKTLTPVINGIVITNGVKELSTLPQTGATVGLGNVTNDTQTKASIMPNTVPTNGQIPIGNGASYTIGSITAGTNITITPGVGTLIISATGVGDALTTDPLSQFASTTSSEFKGVISDENGTGKVLFADGTIVIGTGDTLTVPAGGGTLGTNAFSSVPLVPQSTTVNGHALTGNISVTATDIGLGSVTNDVQTKAAIVPNTVPSSGHVLIGNGSAFAPQSISGHATLSSAGVLTLATIGTITPGAYTNTNITVDAYGRITAIASGASGGGGDVLGPATNQHGTVPTWDGANSKKLANGWGVTSGTGSPLDALKLAVFDNTTARLTATAFRAKAGAHEGIYSPFLWTIKDTTSGFTGTFGNETYTANRTWTGPNEDGIMALRHNIPIKAMVEYNQTITTGSPTGTYTRTSPSGVTTITETAHGRTTGHWIYADFTTGGAASASDGNYQVTVVDANTYTITTAATTTASGNVTMLQFPITATTAFNVHSICATTTVGVALINFSGGTFTDALYRGHIECLTQSTNIGIGYLGWSMARTSVAAQILTVLPTTAAGTAFSSVRVTVVR